MLRLALLASALTLPSLASADDFIPLTYQEFEAAVPHVDLAVCPVPLAAPDRFCRMTSHADQLNSPRTATSRLSRFAAGLQTCLSV